MARPTFTLTVRAGPGPTWPVEAQFIADGGLPVLSHGALTLDAEELLAASTPRTYGQILGEALFCGDIRDAFVRALSVAPPAPLHVLVALDCPELRMFRWELLCAPIDDRLEFLGMTQRVAFARYISSGVDRRFRPLARDGLRALVVIANPDGLDRYSLDPFDEGAATEAVEQALGDIPHDTLSADPRALGLPTMDAICSALTRGHYSVLHVVAHGRHRRDGAEPVLFLSDDAGFARPISQTQLCERLRVVDVSLPHFIFLAACESAAERSEASMGSLAQSLVGKLGIPAVVAMSRQVSVTTASALSIAFYRRLQIHGHVDEALVEATSELSDRQDILVPALYSRLGSRPLFSRGADDADAPRRIPPDAAAASLRTPEIRRSAAIAAGLAAVAAALWFGLPGGAPDATTAPVDAVVVTPSAPSIVVERSAPVVAPTEDSGPQVIRRVDGPPEKRASKTPPRKQPDRAPGRLAPPRFDIGARSGCDSRPFESVIPRLNGCYTGMHDAVHWQPHNGVSQDEYAIFARFHIDSGDRRLHDLEITSSAVDDRAPYACIRGVLESIEFRPEDCVHRSPGETLMNVTFVNSLSAASGAAPGRGARTTIAWH